LLLLLLLLLGWWWLLLLLWLMVVGLKGSGDAARIGVVGAGWRLLGRRMLGLCGRKGVPVVLGRVETRGGEFLGADVGGDGTAADL
jgi:hypothetical protein